MPDRTYKVTQIVGTSSTSFEDAIAGAVKRAAKTLHGLAWFEVAEFRGAIGKNGKVEEWQVKLDVAFRLD